MASPPKNPTEAQALKAKREQDGKKAMAEYEANADAVRVKTEKLRALRLARDAAMPPPAPAKATKAKSAGGKAAGGKAAGGKASGGKSAKAKKDDSGKLSDWIKNQQNSGHNY